MHEPVFGRIVSDSALYGVSAAVAKALALLTVPYLTRALSPAGYGIADLATSTAALLTLIVLFSGDIPAARAYSTAEDDGARLRALSSYIRGTALVSVSVTVALLPAAPLIAGGLWGDGDLTPLALLTLLLVPLSAVQASLAQTQRIQSRPVSFALLSVVDLLAQLGLAVTLVSAGFGPAGVVIGFVLGSLVGLVAAAALSTRAIQAVPDMTLARSMLAMGLRFLPYSVMFVFADWALRAIVANAIGTAGVADLGVAIRVASVLSLLGAAFAMAWGPIALGRANDAATALLFGRVLGAYGVASVGAALALAATGPELVRLVAGSGYEDAALVLPGFALAYALAGTEYVLVTAAGIAGRASRVAIAATIGAAIQVCLAAILIPALGVAAVGPIVVIGRVASFGALLVGIQRSVRYSLPRLLAAGAAILLAFSVLQSVVMSDGDLVVLRWTVAASVAVGGLAIVWRLRRPPRPQWSGR